jgi:hypothetical protein
VRRRGEVLQHRVARGSKSERTAVVLRTGAREYVLRRLGGHPFNDPVLKELVGKTIECDGTIHDYTLIVSSWRVVAGRKRR